MRKILVLVLLIAIGTLSVPLFAGGFALSGVGSRATAMGGAFRGYANDPSAMYWNPAGLAYVHRNSISLGGTFISPSATWENPGAPTTALLRAGETESEPSLKAIPNAFVTMASHPKIKYGLGVFVPYGLGSTWDLYETNPALNGAANFPENETSSSISVFDVHPTVAYQIMPNLSAGAGLSLMYGSIDLAKFGGSSVPGFLLATTDISGKGYGFGANLGVIYKPMQGLFLGLSGRIPSSIKMEGDTKIMNYGVVAPPAGAEYDTKTTLNLPAEAGFGVAYFLKENIRLGLDYSYTMWSALDKVTLDMTTPAGVVSRDMAFDWKDTSRISLGAEYSPGIDQLRAGIYFDQSPIPEETQTPALSDIGDKMSINLGWGRKFGNLGLDLNFQYVEFTERKITTQTANNVLGTYNAQSISGNVGLSWNF